MKRITLAILMAMACILIAGYSMAKAEEEAEEETILDIDSPYTVDHKVLMSSLYNFLPALELTITGPPDDLLVIVNNGEKDIKAFISREQIVSGESKVRFGFGSSMPAKSYQVTIKKSDPSKREGRTVYKGRIDFQGGSVEIMEVSIIGEWPMINAYVRFYNSGDLPVMIDYFVIHSDKGEKKQSIPIIIAPGEYKDAIILYEQERGRDIRIYAYSDGKVVAEFEGKVE